MSALRGLEFRAIFLFCSRERSFALFDFSLIGADSHRRLHRRGSL